MFGVRCLVFGVWCLEFGVWCSVLQCCFLVFRVWCFGVWSLLLVFGAEDGDHPRPFWREKFNGPTANQITRNSMKTKRCQ